MPGQGQRGPLERSRALPNRARSARAARRGPRRPRPGAMVAADRCIPRKVLAAYCFCSPDRDRESTKVRCERSVGAHP
eukprot:6072242-Pyramimonas_sp.AAC.1